MPDITRDWLENELSGLRQKQDLLRDQLMQIEGAIQVVEAQLQYLAGEPQAPSEAPQKEIES